MSKSTKETHTILYTVKCDVQLIFSSKLISINSHINLKCTVTLLHMRHRLKIKIERIEYAQLIFSELNGQVGTSEYILDIKYSCSKSVNHLSTLLLFFECGKYYSVRPLNRFIEFKSDTKINHLKSYFRQHVDILPK